MFGKTEISLVQITCRMTYVSPHQNPQSNNQTDKESEYVTVFRVLELGTGYHKPRPFSFWSVMKAKRSKAHKKTPVRKKSKSRTLKKTRPLQKRPRPPQSPTPTITTVSIPGFKTCEEPEVGDIGGFGDVDAFESHEKLCGEKATEFCGACGKNLCSSHYELLHRDHDAGGRHVTERSVTQ